MILERGGRLAMKLSGLVLVFGYFVRSITFSLD